MLLDGTQEQGRIASCASFAHVDIHAQPVAVQQALFVYTLMVVLHAGLYIRLQPIFWHARRMSVYGFIYGLVFKQRYLV